MYYYYVQWKYNYQNPEHLFFFLNLFLAVLGLLWVFIVACGLSLVVVSGGYSSLWWAGFSLQWLLLLQSMGSRCTGFSSCGTWAQLLRGMWDLPGSGLEPVSPALAGRFLTTAPPGKFPDHLFLISVLTPWLASKDSWRNML